MSWFGFRPRAKAAARSAGEAAAAGLAAVAAASVVWRGPGEARAIAGGVAAAWLASSASVVWLMRAKAVSAQAFWWAFGGGLALRLSTLAGLMAYSAYAPRLSQPALLLSYVFGVIGFLMIEYRHIKLR